MSNHIRTFAARILLTGTPGPRRVRIALGKLTYSTLSDQVTWFGGLK